MVFEQKLQSLIKIVKLCSLFFANNGRRRVVAYSCQQAPLTRRVVDQSCPGLADVASDATSHFRRMGSSQYRVSNQQSPNFILLASALRSTSCFSENRCGKAPREEHKRRFVLPGRLGHVASHCFFFSQSSTLASCFSCSTESAANRGWMAQHSLGRADAPQLDLPSCVPGGDGGVDHSFVGWTPAVLQNRD